MLRRELPGQNEVTTQDVDAACETSIELGTMVDQGEGGLSISDAHTESVAITPTRVRSHLQPGLERQTALMKERRYKVSP